MANTLMPLYSIFDTGCQEYSPVMAMESEQALDNFIKLLVRTHSHSRQHTHPEEFAVFQVGYFDIDAGRVIALKDYALNESPEDKRFVNSFSAYKLPSCKYCKTEDERAEEEFLKQEEELNNEG